ncbi:hypothetical protein LPJGGPFB_05104 [Ensifer adhaerens]|uniref:DUF6766 family protein n=1 Tax=Ensifer adhaerens TaxID=106592 RepID=UPI001567DA79|nr:DUF6766 family protein [Ensifer adhaerens]NRP21845.1 hypothetical protein [Ensifer adhaerens]
MNWRDHGLTIVLLLATGVTVAGMVLSGFSVHNTELAQHSTEPLSFPAYLASGHFLSALFENWESEFLQMSAYVVLTAFLFQRGSAESRDPDQEKEADLVASPSHIALPHSPERKGGMLKTIYAYSLGLALMGLFILSFVLHLKFSQAAHNVEAATHGNEGVSLVAHIASAEFWFESFQNWQSEFLSTAVLVVLSIFLRFRGSPESKSVEAPNSETGSS